MTKGDVMARETAAAQFSAIAWQQLRDAGLSAKQIRTRVERNELLQFSHRSFAIAGSPDTFDRRAKCALLDRPGSALGITTAAAFYGVTGFELEPIHLMEPRLKRSPTLSGIHVVRHDTLYLPPHHVLEINDLTLTSPTRTAADLGRLKSIHPLRAERAIESMWAAGLTNRTLLQEMADEWCERGRRGSAFLHKFLDERGAEFRPPESNLERRFCQIITDAGFPRPVSQVDSGNESTRFGRVDFRDPELPLIAEVDSDRFHLAPLDVANDRARDQAATTAGFEVERFREFEVWHQRDVVVARWRAARDRARRNR